MIIEYLLISFFIAFGISIVVVEKGDDWPGNIFKNYINKKISIFGENFVNVTECTVCFSFWATLISDTFLYMISDYQYFMWPFSGIITLGITWFIIEFLNSIEK